jgi:hypothetical protein
VDVPADAAYSTYEITLVDPWGKAAPVRSLSYAEAQKTLVVVVNPGKSSGKYALIISGQTNSQLASPPAELARIQFNIAFVSQIQQH